MSLGNSLSCVCVCGGGGVFCKNFTNYDTFVEVTRAVLKGYGGTRYVPTAEAQGYCPPKEKFCMALPSNRTFNLVTYKENKAVAPPKCLHMQVLLP